MQKLETILKQKLKNAKRVAILGIGSDLRGDDVAGILAAQHIEKIIGRKKTSLEVRVFIGETAPENLTGEIKRFQPTHLIIIDSADLDKEPGYVRLLNPDEIAGTSFCTHMLPTKVLTDYLLQSFNGSTSSPPRAKSRGCQIITIGIQPKTLAFGAKPSKEVVEATKKLSTAIAKLLNKK